MDSYRKLRETNIISNFFNLSSIQLSNTLLVILSIPIITRRIGIEEFGIMMFASRFSQLAGTVINYGTNQSGVRDVASHLNDTKTLSSIFYNTLFIRIIIFFLFVIFLISLQYLNIKYYTYLLLAIPIVFAEVVNPLFFFIGAEKLKVFNIANLVCNIVTIIILIFSIKGPENAGWVNFILGGGNVVTYLGLLFYITLQYKLKFQLPFKKDIFTIAKDNFYLTINNISVQLQQSIMIFALTRWGNTELLGAYSLCDRIIGQCRNLIITVSNAVYPNAAHKYKQRITLWNTYRRKTKYLVSGIFFLGSILLFILADFIVYTLSKEHNLTAVLFLRTMAIVPTIAALNFTNVLDQLLKNKTIYIFRIAVMLLVVSMIITFLILHLKFYPFIGTITLIVETSALLMYEYVVKKTSVKNA